MNVSNEVYLEALDEQRIAGLSFQDACTALDHAKAMQERSHARWVAACAVVEKLRAERAGVVA